MSLFCLLYVRPRLSVDNRQDCLFGHGVLSGEFYRACIALCIFGSNQFNVVDRKFDVWVIFSLVAFWVFFVEALEAFSFLGNYLRSIVCFVPRSSSARSFGHGVPSVISSSAFFATTSAFSFPVCDIICLRTGKKVFWIYTCWSIAVVSTHLTGLFSVVQKVRYSVGEKCLQFFAGYPDVTVSTNCSARPNPTCAGRSMAWSLVNFFPEDFLFFGGEFRDSSHASPYIMEGQG